MQFVIPIVEIVHVLVSFILIIVVLLQPGKSGDLGSVFGGGTSESVFGASGAVPFLTKLTRLFAVIFFVTSLSLGYFSVQKIKTSVIETTPEIQDIVPDEQEEPGLDTDINMDIDKDVESFMGAPAIPENPGEPEAGQSRDKDPADK